MLGQKSFQLLDRTLKHCLVHFDIYHAFFLFLMCIQKTFFLSIACMLSSGTEVISPLHIAVWFTLLFLTVNYS